jgi:hypothetical protein
MTEIEKKAYASGQSEMRERICALIHQHHYYLILKFQRHHQFHLIHHIHHQRHHLHQ